MDTKESVGKSAKKILTLKIRGYSIENSVPQPLIFVQKNSSQIFHKIISTHLLTVLIIGVILQLEQRRGTKRRKKFLIRKVLAHNTSDFSDSA